MNHESPTTRAPATRWEPLRRGAGDEGSAARRRARPLVRITLARRFIVANVLVFVVAGLLVGTWLSTQVERGILQRTAAVTALYVNSVVEPLVGPPSRTAGLVADRAALDALMDDAAFTSEVAAIIIWAPDGTVRYASEEELIGQRFEFDDLDAALRGELTFGISDLDHPKNAAIAQQYRRLFEVYAPLRDRSTGDVVGVAELYKRTDPIEREVRDTTLASWAIVGLATLASAAVLFLIVKRGSDTIDAQEAALARQVDDLSRLLRENEALNDRVRHAADRSTTVQERSLRRISSDLHDGPGQSLALALLRLDNIRTAIDEDGPEARELEEVEHALQDAMRDMRAIAAGLRLPELATMSATAAAKRAVDEHVRRSDTPVKLRVGAMPEQVSLSVRVSLYRALQELLSNATRHAGGASVRVTIAAEGELLCLTVADDGPGFDPATLSGSVGLGLAGMREQAELLGGSFEVRSAAGAGTTVRVCWRSEPNGGDPGTTLS